MSELFTAVPPALIVGVVAALAAVLSRRRAHVLGLFGTVATLAFVWLAPDGSHLETTLFGFEVVLFQVDGISRLMGLIFAFIGAAAVLYSVGTRVEARQTAIALSYVATSLGAVFAGDWLTLVFFWELMAVTSTVLVWHYGGRAIRTGFRYAIIHGIGGNLVLGAVLWHYVEAGTFLMSADPTGIAGGMPALLAALGIGINVGFVGLHTWLPDTYPSPHVAASVFLCVYTTKTGVYAMYRAFPEGHLWIAYMGGAMAVFGVTLALFQSDMRRLLSFHIQSQVGYMVAGVGIGASLATAGAFEHVFNHILYKSLLFMAVGVIIYRTGTENLYELGGLWREMPITAVAFAIGALSISGFPGFNGYISKGMVMDGAMYAGHEPLWLLLLLGGLGTFLSFIKLGYYAFLHGDTDRLVRDASTPQALAMGSVAALCVLLGVAPGLLHGIVPQTPADLHHFGTSHLAKGFGLAIAGVLGFVVVRPSLSSIGSVAGIGPTLHRAGFVSGRLTMLAVTETYARVDQTAASIATTGYETAADPVGMISRVLDRFEADSWLGARSPARKNDTTYHLRLGIGGTLLVMAATVTLVLVIVVG